MKITPFRDITNNITLQIYTSTEKYRSDSIRDLLRAMRNKRHHYRELPPELLKTLGDIPDGYVNYFASRFPRLLLHTHTIMAECCNESLFKSHYPEVYLS